MHRLVRSSATTPGRATTSAISAALLVALAVPAVAAPSSTQGAGPQRRANAVASGYHDPCERPADALDLRHLAVDDPYEADRRTVVSGDVVVAIDFCGPAPATDLALRLDLHGRIDSPTGSDYDERPNRSIVVTRTGGSWRYVLRDERAGSTVTTGDAFPTTVGGLTTGVKANVAASEIVAAGPDPRVGDLPPVAIRACTADADCGPAYTSDATGRPIPQGQPRADVDYLPDPTLYPVTYPSICQVAGPSTSQREFVASASAAPALAAAGFQVLGRRGDGSARVAGDPARARAVVPATEVRATPVRRATAVPDDPFYASGGAGGQTGQWSLRRVGSETAWDLTTGSPEVRVAVIDSGFDGRHPDLEDVAVLGRDFLGGRANSERSLDVTTDTDLGGHGTFVSSLIAARSDNAVGMAGATWQTSVLVARVLDAEGCATDAAIVSAMDWAVRQGATALNLSLGGPEEGPDLIAAGASAVAAGAIPVAASGNSGGDILEYPAAYASFLSVAATRYSADGSSDRPAVYSSRNAEVDLAAPGGTGSSDGTKNILGACWSGPQVGRGYCREAGTSFATPLVAGALALVAAVDPARTVPGRIDLLQDTAVDVVSNDPGSAVGPDHATGAGRLDTGTAITQLAARTQTLTVLPAANATAAGVAASQAAFGSGVATTAVLARNDVFADALAGASLAQDRGPILLNASASLSQPVRDELLRVLPSGRTVYLLGGPNAVSPTVEQQVRDLGYATRRLAGPSRIETAQRIASEVGGTGGRVLVASAENWPDAVSGGAYAAAARIPLLLSWSDDADDGRSPGLLDALASLAPDEVVLLGGTNALSAEVEADMARSFAVRRVNGPTRFATAVAVAEDLWGRATGSPGDAYTIVNGDRADGWSFGLAASPLAAVRGAPLLLVNDRLTTSDPAAALRTTWHYRLPEPATATFVGPATASGDTGAAAFTIQRLRELLGG